MSTVTLGATSFERTVTEAVEGRPTSSSSISRRSGAAPCPQFAPTYEGTLVFVQPSALSPAAPEDVITQVRALGMDDVRPLAETQEHTLTAQGSAR